MRSINSSSLSYCVTSTIIITFWLLSLHLITLGFDLIFFSCTCMVIFTTLIWNIFNVKIKYFYLNMNKINSELLWIISQFRSILCAYLHWNTVYTDIFGKFSPFCPSNFQTVNKPNGSENRTKCPEPEVFSFQRFYCTCVFNINRSVTNFSQKVTIFILETKHVCLKPYFCLFVLGFLRRSNSISVT